MSDNKSGPPTAIHQQLMSRFKVLGLMAMKQKRIYLDTKFWALLRDHAIGRHNDPDIHELLGILRERVANKDLICTFSGHTLIEIMKHVSPETKSATAELMDSLSRGFCLANQDRLLNNEIVHWLFGLLNPDQERYSLAELAWTKPFFLIQDYTPPELPGIPPEVQFSFQTDFLNSVWSMSMTKVMEHIHAASEPFPELDWPARAVDNINSELRQHDHENNSKKQLYMSEFNGLLDWLGDRLVDLYVDAATQWGKPIPVTADELALCKNDIRSILWHLASKNKIAHQLPSMHIRTALHAAIRWDKQRRFKPNDLMDIEHAQTALPACDYFFTDIPNAQLICSAKLDSTYQCQVTGSPAEALAVIRAL